MTQLKCNKAKDCKVKFCPHKKPHSQVTGRHPNCVEPGTYCYARGIPVNCEEG
ncbi:hypothetical protein LCGC14_1341450 [marine sediment metagenome]|uniref:Uncharacterized protein n=1 Tax=marine sediment metagenome TaxID=412755 RepID=A0A0F9KDJ1_9ZZZZ